MNAMVRCAMAGSDFGIRVYPFTLSVDSGWLVGQSTYYNDRPEPSISLILTAWDRSVKPFLRLTY